MISFTLPLAFLAVAGISLAAPFNPPGGVGLNATPIYRPLSQFDFHSLSLALYQEYIELDLFHHGLAKFSVEEFEAAGINAEDRFLIEFMADQEVGHARMLSNIIGPEIAAKQCTYNYPFETVREFVDFCQKHLNSRAAATLLLDSITTEARQQMIFRQFEGLFPMPIWFVVGITQSMAWTLLAPHITSCPENNTHLDWQNFPALDILPQNNPDATVITKDDLAAITHNRSVALSKPGRVVHLSWENPGKPVGPNGSYTTTTSAGKPKERINRLMSTAQYVAWISQLNTTYTDLTIVGKNTGFTYQPGEEIYGDHTASVINGTMFIMVTDEDPYITPYNVSKLNEHVVAGPAVYQSG
ncbi:Rds1 protein [Trametes sanguinea]|nr:Rds1 protein [Trametes sanguinea]